MSTPQPSQDPLQPVLHETAVELKQHLREACEAEGQDVESETTDELRELEDSLLAAAVAVQQTISLRRHVQKREAAAAASSRGAATKTSAAPPQGDEAGSSKGDAPSSTETPPVAVREFQDEGGRPWRAWSVTPGLRPGRDAKRYLGEFHGGWLCFEALDGSARRRLPRYPPGWVGLEDNELDHLLKNAVDAPERKGAKDASSNAPPREAQAP
jgi:hypothetical protein